MKDQNQNSALAPESSNLSIGDNKKQGSKAVLRENPFHKKLLSLKSKIIFRAIISCVLIGSIITIKIYNSIEQKSQEEVINGLKSVVTNLRIESANIESRINDAKKYKQLWIKADERRKKIDAVKISDVPENLNTLAAAHSIVAPIITISPPEILKGGVYDGSKSLDVNLVNCVLSFKSLNDKISVKFIDNFIKSLPGYVVITDLSIKKSKKEGYSDQDLIDISTGKNTGMIENKVSFSWYFLKHKTL